MEYNGRRQTHDEPGVAETTIAASSDFYVAKETHERYVDDLLPDFIYTFNITAKFLDGTFGPPSTLRIETSPGKFQRQLYQIAAVRRVQRHTGLMHHFNFSHSGALAFNPERQSA